MHCLRTALQGSAAAAAAPPAEHSMLLSYAAAAISAVAATVATAFHAKSYRTAWALLDVGAVRAVLRRHRRQQDAAEAAVRSMLHPPLAHAATADELASLPVLHCAAIHAKAAYGAPAATGYLKSAAGYLWLQSALQLS